MRRMTLHGWQLAPVKRRAATLNVEFTGELQRVRWNGWCTPGMGVNLWGASPLYVSPVNVFIILTKMLAEGKGGTVRDRPEEARVQSYEPTDRNGIQGPVSG